MWNFDWLYCELVLSWAPVIPQLSTVKIFLFKLSKLPFSNCQNYSFQSVKISLFKLSKFPFSNCQNLPFQTLNCQNFLFKLSKFPFSNCQNFPFQTVKISLFKLSKFPFQTVKIFLKRLGNTVLDKSHSFCTNSQNQRLRKDGKSHSPYNIKKWWKSLRGKWPKRIFNRPGG